MRVYLAALTHNYRILANEAMPLVPAYIKALLQKECNGDLDCRIFSYPELLDEAIFESPPDILMASDYLWNEALSLRSLAVAKARSPQTLTVLGGPNFSIDAAKRRAFLEKNPQVDAIIIGEAEEAALQIATHMHGSSGFAATLEDPSFSFLCRIGHAGNFHPGFALPPIKDLNRIPSPWLSGIMNSFFDGRLAPLLETTRGCACRCLYCVQGASGDQQVRQFDKERVREEISFIASISAQKAPGQGYMAIADPEFGAYKKDLEVARAIMAQRTIHGWPGFIDATTGNRRSAQVLQVMECLKDCLVMYNSVQTINPLVEEAIRRRNAAPHALAAVRGQADSAGIRTLTETILGLPGEGYDSHRDGIFSLMGSGFRHLVNYQCMVLKGSDLERDETRQQWGLKTAFRALPRCNGIYSGQTLIEVEEIVIETPALPFDDYLKARRLHLMLFVFYSGTWFETFFNYMSNHGFSAVAVIDRLMLRPPQEKELVHWLHGFMVETREELFETAESCREFYMQPENFERLLSGDIGGNLMFKYLATAALDLWPKIVGYLVDVAKELLQETGSVGTPLDSIASYLLHRVQHQLPVDVQTQVTQLELLHDIPAWQESGYMGEPKSGRFCYMSCLQQHSREYLNDAAKLYGTDTAGLAKLMARVHRSVFEREFLLAEGA